MPDYQVEVVRDTDGEIIHSRAVAAENLPYEVVYSICLVEEDAERQPREGS